MREIINHYGVPKQRRKFAEENLELQEAIMEYQTAIKSVEGMAPEYARSYLKKYRDHLVEELADNFVMLGEFMEYFYISNKEIERVARFKIARTHSKIEEEKRKHGLFR